VGGGKALSIFFSGAGELYLTGWKKEERFLMKNRSSGFARAMVVAVSLAAFSLPAGAQESKTVVVKPPEPRAEAQAAPQEPSREVKPAVKDSSKKKAAKRSVKKGPKKAGKAVKARKAKKARKSAAAKKHKKTQKKADKAGAAE
jgi:hypothetical protein